MSELDNTNSDESKEIQLSWQNIMPYVSMRLFELPYTDWNYECVQMVKHISASLKDVIEEFPSNIAKSRLSTTKAITNKPVSVTKMNSIVFATNTPKFEYTPIDEIELRQLTQNHVCLTAAWFRIVSSPPWLKDAPQNLRDIKHHLVIMVTQPPYAGISSTHEGVHTLVSGFIEMGQLRSIRLPAPMLPVHEEHIENAFVNGETFHLWLKGNHRRITTKPDKKTMEGIDLRHAIDVFNDQSYNYRAIVSKFNPLGTSKSPTMVGEKLSRVGYSKSTKAVWLTKTKDVQEFGQVFSLLREMIQRARNLSQEEKDKIRIARLGIDDLTKSVSVDFIAEAKVPFEVSLNLSDPEPGPFYMDDLKALEDEWRQYGMLEITDSAYYKEEEKLLAIPVNAYFKKSLIGKFVIEVGKHIDSDVAVYLANWVPKGDEPSMLLFDKLDDLINQKKIEYAFSVRFESGHVLTGRNLYKQQYKDILFKGWRNIKLKNLTLEGTIRDFDASLEKPVDWNKFPSKKKLCDVIKSGNSLFSRVANDIENLIHPGTETEWYLLCHDQANEIADFIYIEPFNRRIDLIHIKGANSDDETREISIDAFQIVCAQAVKNLRHLNIYELAARFEESNGHDAGHFMISHTNPQIITYDCTDFVSALEKMKAGLPALHKKVIVFQPHVLSNYWHDRIVKVYEQSIDRTIDSTLRKGFMLSTLLIETEIACHKQGIEFEVWREERAINAAKSTKRRKASVSKQKE
jgi:hypothetical protein